jgi:hypothetical protein
VPEIWGSIMVAIQRIHVGLIHARKIATVTAEDHTFRIGVDGQTVAVVPRTTSREIHKARATQAPSAAHNRRADTRSRREE